MKKNQLTAAVRQVKTETRDALQEMFNELNQGQQRKLLKKEPIKALLDRFGVVYEE